MYLLLQYWIDRLIDYLIDERRSCARIIPSGPTPMICNFVHKATTGFFENVLRYLIIYYT